MFKKWMALIALFTISACSTDERNVEPTLRSVRYIKVANDAGESARTFGGMLRAGNESRLSFQVPGRVEAVEVKLGDKVTEGQTIARLDPTDFELQLSEAQASLAQARAQARSAEANYDRVRKLYTSQSASKQDLDNARAQRDGANSALAAGNQSLRRLKRQLDYAVLQAPGDGTVSSIDLEPSEIISAGRVVAVVQVGEQLEVEVNVPESFIAAVQRGASVEVDVDAAEGARFEGTIVQVGSRGQSVFPVIVRLDGDTSELRAGMTASIRFESTGVPQKAEPTIVVPANAVGEDRDGRFVYLVRDVSDGVGTLKRQNVVVGELAARGIVVHEGVNVDDLVVTAGVARVQDGLKVQVPPLQPQAANAGQEPQ